MPEMPQFVAKGAILKKFDSFSEDRANLERLRTELSAPSPNIPDIAFNLGIATDLERQHLQDDWFGPNRWWSNLPDPTATLVTGLREAVEVALNPPAPARADCLPLHCLWICHHQACPCIKVAVTWSERQVNVVFWTPPAGVPSIPVGQRTIPEPIKVITLDGVDQPIHVPSPVAVGAPVP